MNNRGIGETREIGEVGKLSSVIAPSLRHCPSSLRHCEEERRSNPFPSSSLRMGMIKIKQTVMTWKISCMHGLLRHFAPRNDEQQPTSSYVCSLKE
jgi:hypothetical protein